MWPHAAAGEVRVERRVQFYRRPRSPYSLLPPWFPVTNDGVQERASRVIEEFAGLGDAIDRYRHLVALGEAMPRLPESERTDENRLPGCQYGLWVTTQYDPARDVLHFRADSDAKITRGLAALILQVLDGQPPREIVTADLDFLDASGLKTQLSSKRSNGLSAMIEEMKRRASDHLNAEPVENTIANR